MLPMLQFRKFHRIWKCWRKPIRNYLIAGFMLKRLPPKQKAKAKCAVVSNSTGGLSHSDNQPQDAHFWAGMVVVAKSTGQKIRNALPYEILGFTKEVVAPKACEDKEDRDALELKRDPRAYPICATMLAVIVHWSTVFC